MFYYNNDKNNEIKAGGILFYFKDKDNIKFLMSTYKNNTLSDFGGRIDKTDKSIQETIAREVEEETNGIYRQNYVLEKIKDLKPYYSPTRKYMVYLVELDEDINIKLFGDWEFSDGIERFVYWIPGQKIINKKFLKNKLSQRLLIKPLIEDIFKLVKNYVK